jgi:tight adherence protein B
MNFLILVSIALAVALFAWGAIQIASKGLAKHKEQFTDQTNQRMREMFLFMDPSRLYALHMTLVIALTLVTWFLTNSGLLALAAVAVGIMAPAFTLRHMRQKRLAQFEAQLPDALLVLAGSMRAGASLNAGLQQLVREGQPPLSQEFDLMLREQRLGVSTDEALTHLSARLPLQSVTLMVGAMRIAAETGGGLAEALERASQTLRTQLAMEGKIRSLTAQGKLQAVVVGLLPFAMLLVLLKLEPKHMGLIFTTPIGWGVLGVLVTLEILGILLIRKITHIDV